MTLYIMPIMLQDTPSGEPSVLPPTADKVDVSKIKEDTVESPNNGHFGT